MNLIELENVTKKYGRAKVVDNVSFSIGESEIAVIFGRNGSGKTVLQKIILDLVKGFEGTKTTNCDVYGEVDGPALFGYMTGLENIRCILGDTAPDIVAHYAYVFGIGEFAEKRVAHYSTGMRQRLSLVCAFAKNARLTVLDEPFLGLDSEAVNALNTALEEGRKNGRSFLVATHVLTGLEDKTDRLFLMESGRLRLLAHEELPSLPVLLNESENEERTV